MITKENQQDQLYRYWRIHLMLAMYVGYAGFFLPVRVLTMRCLL